MHPLEGPRFTCKMCLDYDFCKSCFETRSHKHPFFCLNEVDSSPVNVGKAGSERKRQQRSRRAELIKDWTRCIKQVTVSSREGLKLRLFDGTDSCWQSSGPQGKVQTVGFSYSDLSDSSYIISN